MSARLYPASAWRKSSHSQPNGGECLEVADGYADIPVRDSKDPQGPVLTFGAETWSSFLGLIKG